RNSTASCSPVDAPEGTVARPVTPFLSTTSTSTVGCPLESSTSRACTRCIFMSNLQQDRKKHKSINCVTMLRNCVNETIFATIAALANLWLGLAHHLAFPLHHDR